MFDDEDKSLHDSKDFYGVNAIFTIENRQMTNFEPGFVADYHYKLLGYFWVISLSTLRFDSINFWLIWKQQPWPWIVLSE